MSKRIRGRARKVRRGSPRERVRSVRMLVFAALLAAVSLVSLVSGGMAAPKETSFDGAAQHPAKEEKPEADSASDPDATARETSLSTWAERIDAFNVGTPLEGYGRTFAEAAYECGVDPRFAPAIARVESGSGAHCAYACNAWGWGTASWPDWDTAIWEYTAALGAQYGSTLSYEAALSYNEVTPDAWYTEVEASMYQIWESADW